MHNNKELLRKDIVMVIEKCIVSYVVGLPLTKVCGGFVNLFVTDDVEYNGEVGTSYWMGRAKRFDTEDAAWDFIIDKGLADAFVKRSVRTTEHLVIADA